LGQAAANTCKSPAEIKSPGGKSELQMTSDSPYNFICRPQNFPFH